MKIEYTHKNGTELTGCPKFIKSHLYFCLETELESNVKITLQFGPDNLKKIAAIEDERRIKEQVHKQMDKEKLNGTKTVGIVHQTSNSRNPKEAQ